MPQSVEQQKRFVKALVSLEVQQMGSPIGEKLKIVDPAWDAIEARAIYLGASFRKTFDEYCAKETQQNTTKIREANPTPNRVLFCEELTEIAASQLPDMWRLGQAYFTGELRGVNEPKPGNFKVKYI